MKTSFSIKTHLRYKLRYLLLVITTSWLFLGCQPVNRPGQDIIPTRSSTAWPGELLEFMTPTRTATATMQAKKQDIPATPKPSPTPFTHTIVKEDTMLGLALRYGVALEDLLAANPEANPRLLVVGETLIIPILERIEEGGSYTPTPVPVKISEPRCFIAPDDGIACAVEITNPSDLPLENLVLRFGLFSDRKEVLNIQEAVPALNILSPKGALPVVVFFPPPVPESFTVQVEPVMSILAASFQERYAQIKVDSLQVEIAPTAQFAQVSGVLVVSEPVNRVWLAVVAFDVEGQPIGIRKWKGEADCPSIPNSETTPVESTDDEAPTITPQPCEPIEFQVSVFSLGPAIDSVEIYPEAHR